jgi:hypothetical protein
MNEIVNPPAVRFQNVQKSYFLSLLHSFDTQACLLPRPLELETNLEGKSGQVSVI